MTKNAGKTNKTLRKRGVDKSKRNYELNGKYSAKSIRTKEKRQMNTKAKKY